MRFSSRAIVAVAALALSACGEASFEMTPPDQVVAEPENITLREGVIPALERGQCGSCHYGDAASSQFRVDLEPDPLWEELMAGGSREQTGYGEVVNLATPGDSLLLLAPLAGSSFAHSPKPFDDETVADYVTILRWIENGAPND